MIDNILKKVVQAVDEIALLATYSVKIKTMKKMDLMILSVVRLDTPRHQIILPLLESQLQRTLAAKKILDLKGKADQVPKAGQNKKIK